MGLGLTVISPSTSSSRTPGGSWPSIRNWRAVILVVLITDIACLRSGSRFESLSSRRGKHHLQSLRDKFRPADPSAFCVIVSALEQILLHGQRNRLGALADFRTTQLLESPPLRTFLCIE